MKPFLIWSVLTVIVFGGLSGAYHGYAVTHPHSIVVVVDSSFPMQSAWKDVPATLERLMGQRYTKYTVVYTRFGILSREKTEFPSGPPDFSRLTSETDFPEIKEATQKYLITNATAAETNTLKGWTIVRVAS